LTLSALIFDSAEWRMPTVALLEPFFSLNFLLHLPGICYTALPLCYEVQEPHPQPPPRKR